MPIIREPDGVEFTVQAIKLTAKEKCEISEFITKYRQTHDQSDDARKGNEILERYEERKR